MIPLEKIYWLIEDCKRYGIRPFAALPGPVLLVFDLVLPDRFFPRKMWIVYIHHPFQNKMAADHANLSRRSFS
jgi:hypothetical protein